METITSEIIRKIFIKNEIKFQSTHLKLCLPIINRIYKKMMNGIKFEAIRVNGDLIMDGHHRYVSSVLADVELNVVEWPKTSATREYEWSDVEFVKEEWDTPDKIRILNEKDAEFNGLPLEKIIEITK